ncbi:TniB family NTP-binding protein [Mesorhizobium sp.]|uniref:TniB family NTP-binding protein n=1 Tax=Mesorhizobium sp. TaxID=1871066 RepID=UPI003449BAF2
MIFDEFHNALRGRSRDVEAVLAFLTRIGCQYDISPVDRRGRRLGFHQRDRRNGSRFDLLAVPRWQLGGIPHAARQSRSGVASHSCFRSFR